MKQFMFASALALSLGVTAEEFGQVSSWTAATVEQQEAAGR
jgi:hypothetical protein